MAISTEISVVVSFYLERKYISTMKLVFDAYFCLLVMRF